MEIKGDILTIRTHYGTFAVDRMRDKKMAAALASGNYPNESLIKMVRAFLGGGSIAVDIGAHIGTFAVPMAKAAGKVIAFEPFPESFTLLARNAAENDAPIALIHKALGSRKGSGTLLVRNASNAGANTLVAGGDVPITTLDEEVAHANFIKMDVEGMELDVLRGGTKLIERARPTVLFEVNLSQLRAHGTSPRELEHFFTKRGYRLYFFLEEKGMLARVRSATLLTVLIAPSAWLLRSDSAPYDLIAVPQERKLPISHTGFSAALGSALTHNLLVKMHRLRAWLGYHPHGRSN